MKRSFSPSRYLEYARCSKKFQLTRISRVPERAAWYLVGGSAVHLATEMYDKGSDRPLEIIWENAFDESYEEAFREDPDDSTWQAAKGYSGRAVPEKWDAWQEKGLQALKDWVTWRKQHPDWKIVSIEEELRLEEPFVFHGYSDRLFDTPQGLTIVDLKTGSSKPDTPFQLGTYATVYELLGKPRPKLGLYWMSKYGLNQAAPVSLDTYNVHVITEMERMLWKGVENKIFLPLISSQCYRCSVAPACYAFSGDTPQSRKFDPLNPLHEENNEPSEHPVP